jgi:hypothetical protein
VLDYAANWQKSAVYNNIIIETSLCQSDSRLRLAMWLHGNHKSKEDLRKGL